MANKISSVLCGAIFCIVVLFGNSYAFRTVDLENICFNYDVKLLKSVHEQTKIDEEKRSSYSRGEHSSIVSAWELDDVSRTRLCEHALDHEYCRQNNFVRSPGARVGNPAVYRIVDGVDAKYEVVGYECPAQPAFHLMGLMDTDTCDSDFLILVGGNESTAQPFKRSSAPASSSTADQRPPRSTL